MSLQFRGSCDRLRRTQEGEDWFQGVMSSAQEIEEGEFLEAVDIASMLDEGETFEQYSDMCELEGDPCRFFKSVGGVFYLQHAGFEFFFY